MSKILIYLHGLGSRGKSEKSDMLKETLSPLGISVLAPDLTTEPAEVIKLIKSIIHDLWEERKLEKVVFCGTSLGGFFSTYFGEIFDAPYVVVNPVVRPSIAFQRYLDHPPKSWVTGDDIVFTEKTLADYATMEALIKQPDQNNAHVFLAKDDAVIPYLATAEKWKHSHLTITESGGHRYDSEWNLVIDKVKQLFA